MPFNRKNPSPRYRALIELYDRMHREGDARHGLPPQKTFAGLSLLPHVVRIKRLIEATGAATVLDYGSGKGEQYRPQPIVVDGRRVADGVAEFWDVDEVRCYDPAYEPYRALPTGRFDGVVCTDVLEHLPEEDLDWILEEIFGFARRFVFLSVACFPARKTLPNGENAHATVRPPEWWRDRVAAIAARHPALRWELVAASASAEGVTTRVFTGPEDPANVTVVDLDGKPAYFYTPNAATRWRALTALTKEPATIEWLRAMPEDAVFVDVGANVGVYTVFAALARRARVFAFEPESRNYAVLNENLRLNGLGERVVALCAGLSDREGIERLYLSDASAGASCHALGAEVGFDLRPRPAAFAQGAIAFKLDELVCAGRIPVPNFVKIDVDGFEHRVLRGMERTLREPALCSLVVELNPALAEHREVRAFLEASGFRWDPAQVAASARPAGPFQGVAEHVFYR